MKERVLRDKEQQLQAVLDMSQAAILMTRANSWSISYANKRMAELFRCSYDSLCGSELIEFIHPFDIENAKIDMHMLVTGEIGEIKSERRLIRKDGSEFSGTLSAQALVRENGSMQGVMVTIYDDSRLVEAEHNLSIIENNYWEIFNSTNDAVFVHDAYTGAIVEVNKSVEKIYGYSREEIFFLNVNDLSSGEPPYSLRESIRLIRKAFEVGPQSFEWLARKKNGDLFWAEMSLTSSHIGGEGRVLSVVRDISDRKEIEQKLQHLSSHDALSGLYNRLYFETEFDRLAAGTGYPVTVIVADLDGLKPVNDTYGHEAGDRMIKSAADILSSVFRATDVVARIGGDEFAVLLPKTDAEQAAELIARIRNSEERFNLENSGIRVRISMGSATACSAEEMEGLMGKADKFMYQDKYDNKPSGKILRPCPPPFFNPVKEAAVLMPE